MGDSDLKNKKDHLKTLIYFFDGCQKPQVFDWCIFQIIVDDEDEKTSRSLANCKYFFLKRSSSYLEVQDQ